VREGHFDKLSANGGLCSSHQSNPVRAELVEASRRA
jgi:hypothetical protein